MATAMGRMVRAAIALGAALLLLVVLALWRPVTAAAATLTVTTTGDTTNLCAIDGTSQPCSLRDAVTFANNHDSTTIAFNLPNASTITLTGGTLTLTRTTGNGTSINGPGAAALAIDGGCTFNGSSCTAGGVTVFTVNSRVKVTIRALTIQHGNSAALGGGIVNHGTLTLLQATVKNNTGYSGGGIVSVTDGGPLVSLEVDSSSISGNTATAGTPSGGGIENQTGSLLTLMQSTVSGNSAHNGGGIGNEDLASVFYSTISNNTASFPGNTGTGGGIRNNGMMNIVGSTINDNQATGTGGGTGGGVAITGGTLTMASSTLSGNRATSGGGIHYASGTGTLTHVTFSGNSTGIDGTSALTLTNSILANTGANCTTGAPTDGKYNLISDATCNFTDATDLIGVDPLLLPLGDYGGSTQTHALKFGSPVINSIPATGNNCMSPDQRAAARPFGATCDMGAVEFSFTVSPSSGTLAGGTLLTLTGSGLVPGMTLSLGGSACIGVSVNAAGTVATCGTGAHAAGAVDLTLAANGHSETFPGLYAYIAPVVVTTTGDTTNPCATSGTGTCSLRDAVTFANNNDSITILFNLPKPSTITLTQGTTLMLARTTGNGTTITGPGAAFLAVDGGCTLSGSVCAAGGVSVFTVNTGVAASISGLTIQHGTAFLSGTGGGIVSQGTLTVTSCTLSGNVGFNGGGVAQSGDNLTVTNSTFSGNSANSGGGSASGGGISISGIGQATITNSTFSGNAAIGASGNGGGIRTGSGVITFITNSTFIGNTAGGGGGGLFNAGTTTVTNSTFSANAASGSGGGILSGVQLVTLINTIVANSPTGGDLAKSGSGGITGNHNLIDDAASAGGFTDGTSANIIGHPALLGSTGIYGSANGTQTIPLLSGSPAIDAGDDTTCAAPGAGNVNSLDQRGIARPQGTHCDIGAFEYSPPTTLPGAKMPGGSSGPPSPIPGTRPTGQTGGPLPNSLPPSRP